MSILAWGALPTVNPSVLAVSYETYTGVAWLSIAAANLNAAGSIL